MNPEEETIKHRAPRLKPDGIELVKQSVETGAITRLTGRQQLVLRGRYLSGDDQPPTQEELAKKLYPKQDPRKTKANISDFEKRGLDALRQLTNHNE